MKKKRGGLFGILITLASIYFGLYILTSGIGIFAGIVGTVWGGFTALKNYVLSFKENMIDSNRVLPIV